MIDHETRQKHTASFSFVILMVLIVLPVWWKTTEVYKASFPYTTVDSLHTRPITQRADILLVTAEEEDARVRYQTFHKVASKSVLFSVSLTSRTLRTHEAEIISNAGDIAEIDEKVGSSLMQGLQGGIVFLEIPSTFFSDVPHLVLGNYRTVYFSSFVPSEDLAAMAVDTVLGEHKMLATIRTMTANSHSRPAPSDSAAKRTRGHLDIFLSLLVPQPEFVMASWDIQAATKQYLEPFLAGFPLNFSVSSQVVYLSPLNIPAAADSSGGVSLSPEQLGLSVNTVESLLASQSSSAPGLNLLVYIPPIESSPMTLIGSDTDSFLIPRWGGVNIYNYVSSEEQNISFPLNIDVDMRKVMGVWIGQIRSLLGVEHVKEYETLPLRSVGMRSWEMDYQLRYRTLENILDSRSTLTSLSHLLSQIPNIVISDEIGSRVETSLKRIESSQNWLSLGDLSKSYEDSVEALVLAENAFFDKSLLELLYFPDDQKYAIYIPYFLPVGFPVLLSLKSLIKFVKESRKAKTD